MNVVAIIPARGGSKAIPRKNLVDVAGKPLIAWTIEQALASDGVSSVWVSSEDEEILETSRDWGANTIHRPMALATDEATSEDVLLDVLGILGYDPDLIVFLQCTSPIRQPDDIDRAIEAFLVGDCDSLFSAVETYRILWHPDYLEGPVLPRLPRQQYRPQWMENGSIYIFRPETLRRLHSRFGKRIAVYPMDYWSQFEVDESKDLELVRMIMEKGLVHV